MFAQYKKPIIIIIFILLGIGVFTVVKFLPKAPIVEVPVAQEVIYPKKEIIGKSVEGRDIESLTFGDGPKKLMFVGGIHGGYEWNSVLLAHEFVDYFTENLSTIPKNISVVIIPSLNPDAVFKVAGKEGIFEMADVSVDKTLLASARFNSHNVDLNRNFDCNWKPEATWQSKKVSAGSEPFSEPEVRALQNFVLKQNPVAVVFWHSQANTVYAGDCNGVFLPQTLEIMKAYAGASGYLSSETFDSYPVSGSADGWLTNIKIPSLTVELKTHESIEWDKNLAGVKALLDFYSK